MKSSRAPALYVSGLAAAPGVPARSFRLPLPPQWDDRAPSVWAVERRARKAYFAALDALASGQASDEALAKLERLAPEVRSATARHGLEHLARVMRFARDRRAPVLPPAGEPLAAVSITVHDTILAREPAALEARYAWALEWLRMRRHVVGKGLRIEWRVEPHAGLVVAPAPARARRFVHRALAQRASA